MTAIEAGWQKNIYPWGEHKWKYLGEEGGGRHQGIRSRNLNHLESYWDLAAHSRVSGILPNYFLKEKKTIMLPAIIMHRKLLTLTFTDFLPVAWRAHNGWLEKAAREKEATEWLSCASLGFFIIIAAFSHMLFKGTDKPGLISKEFLNLDFKIIIASLNCQCSVQETQIYLSSEMFLYKCWLASSVIIRDALDVEIDANKLPIQLIDCQVMKSISLPWNRMSYHLSGFQKLHKKRE